MSDSKKYLRNGSISPLWQEAQYQKACEDHDMERFSQFLNSLPINYCSNVDEFVDKQIEHTKQGNNMVTIVKYPREVGNVYDELMSRYAFLEDVWDGEDGVGTKIAKIVLETF